MHDSFFLIISHVLKFDVIYVIILIYLIAARGTLCCNGQGPCDLGPNPFQGLLN
jgi:hypothetical protein